MLNIYIYIYVLKFETTICMKIVPIQYHGKNRGVHEHTIGHQFEQDLTVSVW